MSRPLELSASEIDSLAAAVIGFVRTHVTTLADQPASDVDGASDLAATFREHAPETGHAIGDLLARLAPAIAKSFNTAGPGYLAFIPGGGVPAAAFGELISLAVNRYVGVAKAAPVLAEIESTTVRWLAKIAGYGEGAGGVLTSGGSMSNLLAIVTARSERLGESFAKGTVYCSRETHLSVSKSARFAGIPSANVRALPVDARWRLDVRALVEAVDADARAGLAPFFVVANAGTTNTGAIDPLADVAAFARERGLWSHADAAYGGFFRLAKDGEERLRGLERFDSITLDPHKGLFLPYGTGCLVVRDPSALRRAHEGEAEYLRDVASDDGAPSFTDLSPELSREMRGLRLWLPLMLHGLGAFRAQIDEKLALARLVYEELRADGRFEIVDEPQLSVVAFRLRGAGDAVNRELLARVNARRRVFLSSTVLDRRVTLRVCVLSFRTHEDRVREAIEDLRAEASSLLG